MDGEKSSCYDLAFVDQKWPWEMGPVGYKLLPSLTKMHCGYAADTLFPVVFRGLLILRKSSDEVRGLRIK